MNRLMQFMLWLAHLPHQKITLMLASCIATIIDKLDTDAAQTTRINLQTCFPDLSAAQIAKLRRESLTQMTLLFFEFAQLAHYSKERLLGQISSVEGQSLLDEAAASGEGVLLLVPHFGNWEIFCAFLGHFYGFAALYDPPKIASLEPMILKARERFNGELFAIDTAGMRNLLRVLKQGKLVAILPDQVPERNAGVYADFFGQPALTMNLIHRLVHKHPRKVLMASVERVFNDAGYSYKICIEPAVGDMSGEDVAVSAKILNQSIEQVVKRAPAQYQWAYKRFKRPPQKGVGNIYRRQ
jgi:Kdo2-lipid IVA lauroyltransferase/acyltransferase